MAEDRQPPTIVEGANTGDVEDELPPAAASAEDRKAAAALAKLDAVRDDDAAAGSRDVDHEAVSKAMKNLAGGGGGKKEDKKEAGKKVKVDAGDVALLVDELDLTKPRATELLKMHDGDAVKAMRAFIAIS